MKKAITRILILTCIIWFFLLAQNVSNAAVTWTPVGNRYNYSRDIQACTDTKHTNCTKIKMEKPDGKEYWLHIQNKKNAGLTSGNTKPELNWAGILCLQHGRNLGDTSDAYDLEYTITLDGATVTTERLDEAKYTKDIKDSKGTVIHKKGEYILNQGNMQDAMVYKMAYVFTTMSHEANKRLSTPCQWVIWKNMNSFIKKMMKSEIYTGDLTSLNDTSGGNLDYGDKLDSSAIKQQCEDLDAVSSEYATFASNWTAMVDNTNAAEINGVEKGNNTIIGPFNFSFSSGVASKECGTYKGQYFGGIDEENCKVLNSSGAEISSWKFCDANGSDLKGNGLPQSATNFYISVPKTEQGVSKLVIGAKKLNVGASFYTMKSASGKQNWALMLDTTRNYISESKEIEFGGNILIQKEGKNGVALSGVKFNVQGPGGYNYDFITRS